MDVIVNIGEKFDKDVKKFPTNLQKQIEKKVTHLIKLLQEGLNTSSHLSKIHNYQIGLNMDVSLYVLKVNKDLRVILTSEEDPLFNEHILTLVKIVKHNDLDVTFKNIAESIIQSVRNKDNKGNG
jgi:mRNA-degrading endonuclease YafQ of YafQ-DinJ toxin-antitoxin module